MVIGHQKQWDFLISNLKSGRLGHSYLFSGQDELGKKRFALDFAKIICCQNKTDGDDCQNCRLIGQEKHPDVLMVKTKEDKSEIEISQIREVQRFLSLKPYYGTFKIVIIDGAEKMNNEAQSCFLKTLEEPKGNTLLILICSKVNILLPTILSRCQIVKFFPVSKNELKNFLASMGVSENKAGELAKISDGKPGRALMIAENPKILEQEQKIFKDIIGVCGADLATKFRYAKEVSENSFKEVVSGIERYFRYVLLLKTNINVFKGNGYLPEPSEKIRSYSISKIKEIIKLAESVKMRLLTTNANPKLSLEILLLEV